ncbi:MAG: hypothetical protein AAFV77_07560 [Planctomycetota bacterium]
MLVINPQSVSLIGQTIERVRRIAIHRSAERLLVEWGNMGPYPVFADVPEQRVELELVADLERGTLDGLEPGDEGALEFFTSPSAGSGGRTKIEATVVVTDVRDGVEPGGSAQRRIRMEAVSASGTADPIVISDAEDGSR